MASHPKETSTGLLSADGRGRGAADAAQLGSTPAVVLLFVLPWEPLRLLSGGTRPMHRRDALAWVPCSRDKCPWPDGTELSQVLMLSLLNDTSSFPRSSAADRHLLGPVAEFVQHQDCYPQGTTGKNEERGDEQDQYCFGCLAFWKMTVIQVTLEKNETSQKHLIYSTLNLHKWAICTELSAWSNTTAKESKPPALDLPRPACS
ncbi:uncharacterized protein LOC121075302 isoform X1 [Cygnus olor]|uniref:uncharacterized protein LOC121075302 isoform X1 n=1 Tax=Cygnus olor TaxID=8869 RepID=UPI001ADE0579|nr:uncharacterized protein LOC121075302 isoform X1 [Cygnus olor]